ncbi:SH3 domain-containing protein [Caldovatus aquaticus]|uniref:SH3 domain-containing protein n=1 Tax=Caldovatus aquaticus TaxID=2865671 RepID=A0ABS7F7H6_9PROT|nr:SH3 domain-containing protein [Caldovatus aquaticus]MBW8271463.1 SH3 domain-containing protein [Caldovatus aquaticus]
MGRIAFPLRGAGTARRNGQHRSGKWTRMGRERAWLLGAGLLLAFGAAGAVVAFLLPGAPGRPGPKEAAQRQPDRAVSAAAAAPEAEEAVAAFALAAVRARLAPTTGDRPRLFELRVRRFGARDEVAVCGFVLGRDGATAEPFVARVLLPVAAATAALSPFVAAGDAGNDMGSGGGRLRTRMPLVVLEEGPGLSRGGLARHRYCREVPTPQTRLPAAPAPPIGGSGVAASAAAEVADRTGPAGKVAPLFPGRRGEDVAGQGPGAWDGGGSPGPAGNEAGRLPGDTAETVVLRMPANLRSGPGGDYPVIATAPRGTAFVALGRAAGGWVRVSGDGGFEGWVHASLLE